MGLVWHYYCPLNLYNEKSYTSWELNIGIMETSISDIKDQLYLNSADF